jgi:hypothetical protein
LRCRQGDCVQDQEVSRLASLNYHCIWTQRLDAANRPAGAPFAVYHLHSARRSTAILPLDDTDLFVGRDQLLVSLSEMTGNIWSASEFLFSGGRLSLDTFDTVPHLEDPAMRSYR